jgi:hypothetical protein
MTDRHWIARPPARIERFARCNQLPITFQTSDEIHYRWPLQRGCRHSQNTQKANRSRGTERQGGGQHRSFVVPKGQPSVFRFSRSKKKWPENTRVALL